MSSLKFVPGHPTLRLIAAALALLATHNASVYPYQSRIAIEKMGLSTGTFSRVPVLASVVAVTSSVLFGILDDQFGRRLIGVAISVGGALLLLMADCRGWLDPVSALRCGA